MTPPVNVRLDLLVARYLNALERGDHDAASAMWQQAAIDPELESALTELHAGLVEEQDRADLTTAPAAKAVERFIPSAKVLAERNGHAGYSANGYPIDDHVRHLKAPNAGPTYFHMLFRQIQKRGRLLAIWMCITAGVTAFVVTHYSQTMWKAEGALYYSPNFNFSSKPLFTPPNMQTVLGLAQSPELLDKLAKENELTPRDLKSKLNVVIRKQSDVIAVTFEAPNKEKAEEVSNRVLLLAVEEYDQLCRRLVEKALVGLNADLNKATEQELAALKSRHEWLRTKGIADLKLEMLNVASSVADLQKRIEADEVEMSGLEKKIAKINAFLTESAGLGLSSSELAQIQEVNKHLSVKQLEVQKARFELKPLEDERIRLQPLYEKGNITKKEWDEVITNINIRNAVIIGGTKDIEEMMTLLVKLQKAVPEALKTSMQDKLKYEIDLIVLPGKMAALRNYLDKRVERQKFLREVEKDDLEKQQEIEKLLLRRNNLTSQKQEHEKLEASQTGFLTIHTPASAGNAPSSSDHLKLAFATFGLSLLLFVGFVALFDMPRTVSAAKSTSPASQLPVPLARQGVSVAPKRERPPLPPRGSDSNTEQLRLLAERIAPSGSQGGKIVLFTPTAKGLRLESLLGDLACMLPAQCGKVLVFEARTDLENPPYPVWTGPGAREVADYLTSYLEGGCERTKPCFAETRISTIDYARGDLSRYLLGEQAMHRFRRLINDMKERYSLVLMITPERCQSDDGNVFTPLGEGIVVVVNQDANPDDVEQYLRELRASEMTVYGAFTAPPGQSST